MLNSNTCKSTDDKTEERMKRHLFIEGAICFSALLTPFCSMYRCWKFGSGTIEYQEYYIFGIRIARRRL